MSIRMGEGDLVSRLMVADLGANSIFYHKSCYTNLHNEYVKICKENKDHRNKERTTEGSCV